MDIKILASGSSGNCYWVSDGVTELLIECGISWKRIQRALNFETSKIAACLISHEHQDHCKALKDVTKAGIDCWLSAGAFDALGLDLSQHRVHWLSHGEWLRLGSWFVQAFKVQHDAAEPMGFLLQSGQEKLLYATDTAFLRYRFEGLTEVMIECNYSLDLLRESVKDGAVPSVVKRRIMESHFSLENVIKMLRANDLSKVVAVYLLHLSENNADRELFKTRVQEATGKVVIVA